VLHPDHLAFTLKARRELASLEFGFDEQDACVVLTNLSAEDSAGRLESAATREWMYLFKPVVAGTVYVKLILRNGFASSSRSTRTKVKVMKKMRSHKVSAVRRGPVLPDDAARPVGLRWWRGAVRYVCPSTARRSRFRLPPTYVAPRCGEVVLRFQDSKRLSEDAIAIYRKKARAPLCR